MKSDIGSNRRTSSNYLEINEILDDNCKNRRQFIVGLSGGICAGKTDFINQFKNRLGNNMSCLSLVLVVL